MSKSNSIPVIQLTRNGDFVKEWPSTKAVSQELCVFNLARVLSPKNGQITAGGFKWEYKDENYVIGAYLKKNKK